MAYATATDVSTRLGRPLDTDETQLVTTRLADAELLLKARIPDLDAQITAGTLSTAVVVMVEADMILRLVKNKDGFTTETDGGYSYTIAQDVASGKLMVLQNEWALLGLRSAIYTIAPTLAMPTAVQPDPWWW